MLYAITNKTQSNREWTIVLFGADAPDVYVRASMLRYFHVFILKLLDFFLMKGACSVILIMAISVNRCVEMEKKKKIPFNGVTNYCRVWRKGTGKLSVCSCSCLHPDTLVLECLHSTAQPNVWKGVLWYKI